MKSMNSSRLLLNMDRPKKLVFGSLILLICLVGFSDACLSVNRRLTTWIGNPGPDGTSTNSMLVTVYRTDQFNYNTDHVDARVTFQSNSLTKVSKPQKNRLTPGSDDLTGFLIETAPNDDSAFQVLHQIGTGIYQIVFRAHYSDFPLSIDVQQNPVYWVSLTQNVFYYVSKSGEMVTVTNIEGSNRDFNSTTSTWYLTDISETLFPPNTTLSIGSGISLIDSIGVVMINYAATSNNQVCDQGSAVYFYEGKNFTFFDYQTLNSAYWWDSFRAWWAYADDATVTVVDYLTKDIVFSHTYSATDLANIVSRASLGAWLGPLLALTGLWIAITVFCAIACRSRC